MTPKRARPPLLAGAPLALVALGAAGAILLTPPSARAACQPNAPVSGDTVTCSGTDDDGFDAGAANMLTVNVEEGARVDPTGAMPAPAAALILNDDNRLILDESAAIRNSGVAMSDGVIGGDRNRIRLRPGATIETNTPDDVALRLGNDNVIRLETGIVDGNASPAEIRAATTSGAAIEAGGGTRIENRGRITAGAGMPFDGAAIRLTGPGNTIINEGTIIVTPPMAAGLEPAAIDLSAAPAGAPNEIVNSFQGRIEARSTRNGLLEGDAIRGSPGREVVRNGGEIVGSIRLAGGDDELVLATTGTLFVNPMNTVYEGGTGTDTLRLEGPSFATLSLDLFTGWEELRIDGGMWNLRGTGTIPNLTRVSGGTLAPRGTLTLMGDYEQAAGAAFSVRLLGQNLSDQLVVAGTASIDPKAVLRVVPFGFFGETSVFTILTTTGGFVGPTDTTEPFQFPVNRVSAVLSLEQQVVGNQIQLVVQRRPYAVATVTANQRATGGYLDAIRQAGPSGDLALLLAGVDLLPPPLYLAFLDQVQPEAFDAHTNTMISWGRSFARAALARRPECEPVAWPSDPRVRARAACSEPGWTPWIAPVGNLGKRNGSKGHIDFDVSGAGVAAGLDRHLGDGWVATGYVGGGDADLEGSFGEGEFASVEAGAALAFERDGWGARGAVAYGYGWHETTRPIASFARIASSDHESQRVTVALEAGRSFPVHGVSVEPLVGVDWTGVWEDEIRESGAGGLDLRVPERDFSVLSTTAGVRLAYTGLKHGFLVNWLEWADGVWRPEITARWRGVWTDAEREYEAQFAGAPVGAGSFTVEGEDAEHAADLEARVLFQPEGTGIQVGAFYDGLIGDGTRNHFFGAEIRIPLP